MTGGSARTGTDAKESRFILLIQYLLPVTFSVAMLSIVGWIIWLIMLSVKLQDIPSASVGISIVAIPVFLLLLGVFWYVFLAIIRDRDDGSEDSGTAQAEEVDR
jgi:hypothetical protein